ncbi:hypothetical protein H8356DRAFT_1029541 [Neocallimastix lanati (nom. inval.)]|jgi:hypothetical protein|uniref:Uncharacterized protein n=1 Tax=Neocallimastix californiae TaxID=1754190 RepID=A0A1Y2FTL5_9FUNG|nr:hypothetical protein H8356DRAFT_1029541 [Neocallimastix sp. JGI-2020a]ORY87328.1 hypothetical protein LY90DRAFT_663039 [Neocallimastix californiae]|eukprot:ORY87328.1 hypothetical protein LY90DRAFT_663039 [Neocallimastix californiae]
MAAEKKEFKRHFPVISKCYCCCCMDMETALKLCSIILSIFSAIGLIYSNRYENRSLFLRSLAEFFSLIFLTIGLFNKNVSFMRPFLFVCVIEVVILIGFYLILVFEFFITRESIIDDILVETKEDPDLIYYYDNEEAIASVVNIVFILISLLVIIFSAIYIYFFLCVGSYMETIKEEQYRIDEARKLESDEASLNNLNNTNTNQA